MRLVSQSPVLGRGVLRKLGSQVTVTELELGQKFKQKVSVVLELSLFPEKE